jgi:hypothetical protein
MGSLRKSSGAPMQGLYEESASQLMPLGYKFTMDDGREFVYGRCGAVAGVNGRMYSAEAVIANHGGTGLAVATELTGDRVVAVTLGATLVTENQYAEGYLVVVNDTTAIAAAGSTYKIAGHPAADASVAVNITLKDPLWEGIGADSTVCLVRNPHAAVVINPAANDAALVGIPLRDLTALYYGWFQTRGICGCLQDGAIVNGDVVAVSDGVAGAVQPITATQAIDEVEVGEAVSDTATGDVGVIFLRI